MTKTVIVADIGGTHTRLGLWEDGALRAPEKLKTASCEHLSELVTAYRDRHGLPLETPFAFATAANPFADGTWRFTNLEGRSFTLSDFGKCGLKVLVAEDDFAATAYGCIAKKDREGVIALRAGNPVADAPKIVLGPGTGLGMGYGFTRFGKIMVQKTYGGHMLFTPVTERHGEVARAIASLRALERPVIFEDIACGSAFPWLFRACAAIGGHADAAMEADDIFGAPSHPAFIMALDVFHEALGLFAHTCAITLHGFGGIVMNGGFLDALIERELWSADKFLAGFGQKGVPVVAESLAVMPVSIVQDTYISLLGLGAMLDGA
ncbi:MAG: glucokinase [Micavibrio sp.]